MRVIGISGRAGVGKDTVAGMMQSYGFVRVALADPLKRFARTVLGFSYEQLWGPSECRNAVDPRYGRSPREALQTLGTEWGRHYSQDIWVRFALDQVRLLAAGKCQYIDELGLIYNERARHPAGVVIPDVRFTNERDAIGETWRVVRTDLKALPMGMAVHASENELTDMDLYNLVVFNGGSLADLQSIVDRRMR